MNAFKNLWTAIAQLAASVANLAETINGIDGQLRQRTSLDEAPASLEANGDLSPAVLSSARKRKPALQHPTE